MVFTWKLGVVEIKLEYECIQRICKLNESIVANPPNTRADTNHKDRSVYYDHYDTN